MVVIACQGRVIRLEERDIWEEKVFYKRDERFIIRFNSRIKD